MQVVATLDPHELARVRAHLAARDTLLMHGDDLAAAVAAYLYHPRLCGDRLALVSAWHHYHEAVGAFPEPASDTVK